MEKIEFRVQNSGLYGRNITGTWSDLLEEIGLNVPGWATYDVDRTEWQGGKRHYWGGLYDDNGKRVYGFWAVVDESEAEVEISPA